MQKVIDWLKKPQNVLAVLAIIGAFIGGIQEGYHKALELANQKEAK